MCDYFNTSPQLLFISLSVLKWELSLLKNSINALEIPPLPASNVGEHHLIYTVSQEHCMQRRRIAFSLVVYPSLLVLVD